MTPKCGLHLQGPHEKQHIETFQPAALLTALGHMTPVEYVATFTHTVKCPLTVSLRLDEIEASVELVESIADVLGSTPA